MKWEFEPARYIGHTTGRWQWFGNSKSGRYYLATIDRGRQTVMDFCRARRDGAQPRFQIDCMMEKADDLSIHEVCPGATCRHDKRLYRHDIKGFRSADSRVIEDAAILLEKLTLAVDLLKRIEQSNAVSCDDLSSEVKDYLCDISPAPTEGEKGEGDES